MYTPVVVQFYHCRYCVVFLNPPIVLFVCCFVVCSFLFISLVFVVSFSPEELLLINYCCNRKLVSFPKFCVLTQIDKIRPLVTVHSSSQKAYCKVFARCVFRDIYLVGRVVKVKLLQNFCKLQEKRKDESFFKSLC